MGGHRETLDGSIQKGVGHGGNRILGVHKYGGIGVVPRPHTITTHQNEPWYVLRQLLENVVVLPRFVFVHLIYLIASSAQPRCQSAIPSQLE